MVGDDKRAAGLRADVGKAQKTGPHQPAFGPMGPSKTGSELGDRTQDKTGSGQIVRPVGQMLKKWRTHRQLSQSALAKAANVSSRHISFIETNRARPSRKMVLRLSEVLDLPFRARNALLRGAGYEGGFPETPLTDDALSQIADNMEYLIACQGPYPAIIADGKWNIHSANRSAGRVFSLIFGEDLDDSIESANIVDWLVDSKVVRESIENWSEVAVEYMRRLHHKIDSGGGDVQLHHMLAKLVAALEETAPSKSMSDLASAVLPIRIRRGRLQLNLHNVILKMGTPRDITLEELEVEAFYPADRETETLLRSLNQLS